MDRCGSHAVTAVSGGLSVVTNLSVVAFRVVSRRSDVLPPEEPLESFDNPVAQPRPGLPARVPLASGFGPSFAPRPSRTPNPADNPTPKNAPRARRSARIGPKRRRLEPSRPSTAPNQESLAAGPTAEEARWKRRRCNSVRAPHEGRTRSCRRPLSAEERRPARAHGRPACRRDRPASHASLRSRPDDPSADSGSIHQRRFSCFVPGTSSGTCAPAHLPRRARDRDDVQRSADAFSTRVKMPSWRER